MTVNDDRDKLLTVTQGGTYNTISDGPAHITSHPIDANRTKETRALTIALVICLIFMAVEVVTGILSHSLSLITDAAHMLTDVWSMAISLIALHLAQKSADKQYTYGWHRAEVIGAFGSVLTIWVLVGGILWEALNRIYLMYNCIHGTSSDCLPVDARMMLIVGFVGLILNIMTAGILFLGGAQSHSHSHSHSPTHSHSHSHSHSHGAHKGQSSTSPEKRSTKNKSQQCKGQSSSHNHLSMNVNLRGALLHAFGDCLQNVGVIVAAAVIWIGNLHHYGKRLESRSLYNIADPACSILFALVTVSTTFSLFRQLLGILMETAPSHVDYDALRNDLLSIPSVLSIHHLHLWSITTDKLSLSVHIVTDNHEVSLKSAQEVCNRHGILHTTIQVDSTAAPVQRCLSNISCA